MRSRTPLEQRSRYGYLGQLGYQPPGVVHQPAPDLDELDLHAAPLRGRKEGKYALNWTRLSYHRFVASQLRLALFILAYNLGNFLRRLCLAKAVMGWSLRSLQLKFNKMGGRLVRHARRPMFQLTEVAVPREVFRQVLEHIGGLHPAPG